MYKKYLGVILVVLLVVTAGLALALFKKGYFSAGSTPMITVGLAPATALPGKVLSVSDDRFILAVEGDLAPSPELTERTVLLTPDTPVLKEGAEKDPETAKADFEASEKLLREISNLSDEERSKFLAENAPKGGEYILETSSVRDIVAGMDVVVFTETDVRQLKEFSVTQIRILNKE